MKATGEGWAPAELGAQQKKLHANFQSEIIIRSEDFARLVSKLKTVKKVQLRVRGEGVAIGSLAKLSSQADRTMIEFGYDKDSPFDTIKEGIGKMVSSINPWKVRVEGTDAQGNIEIINLAENIDSFYEMDFDADVAKDLDLDLSNPAKSLTSAPMIDRLLKIAGGDRVKNMLEI